MDSLQVVFSVLPLVSAPLLQLPALRKAWDEVRHLRQDRKKRDAEFATKLFEQSGDVHVKRYAEELAYAALVGDNHLSHQQRRFLLSCEDAQKTIGQYLLASVWVQIDVREGRFAWKTARHGSRAYRIAAQVSYLLGYLAWGCFASAPILLSNQYDPHAKLTGPFMLGVILFFMAIGMPLAAFCLRRSYLLRRAAKLVNDSATPSEAIWPKTRPEIPRTSQCSIAAATNA
ncbi:hypothetical protein [Cupriavidus plantarum]|uniref:Uncharacterized protein n=1 Tax=Cupriavidus plantarum TaxID=942865 RepID=A0A316EQ01_9BURK|nr:hypothetical protein [Cupriavidus plantarum]PWK32331.1 hypothetical protein C7419_107122 [Cupriavidus plantarum]